MHNSDGYKQVEKPKGDKVTPYLAIGVFLFNLFALGFNYTTFRNLKKQLKEMRDGIYEAPSIFELMKDMKEDMNMIPGIHEQTKMLRDYSLSRGVTEFKQDPEEFAVLGLPGGSHIEGEYKKGGDYKVITPVDGEKFAFVQPVIKGL